MTGYAWVLEVRPGYEDEYDRRHAALPVDMVELLNLAGFRNYSIFRFGLTLFGYFEVDDLEKSLAIYTMSDAAKRWGEIVGPIMKLETDPETKFPFLLPKVWHFEGRS